MSCRAKATVLVTYLEPKEAGGPVPAPIYTLSSIHSREVHNHEPDDAKHIADHIMQVIKEEYMKNPSAKPGKLSSVFITFLFIFPGPMAERIIFKETQKYEDNEPLKTRILNSFPQNRLQTLYSMRKTLPGYIPGLLY